MGAMEGQTCTTQKDLTFPSSFRLFFFGGGGGGGGGGGLGWGVGM